MLTFFFIILAFMVYSLWCIFANDDDEVKKVFTSLGIIVFCVILLAVGAEAIVVQSKADLWIAENRLEYENLLAQYEALDDENATPFFTSTVLDKVCEYNQGVLKYKTEAKNPWINWFRCQGLADAMQFIGEVEEVEE